MAVSPYLPIITFERKWTKHSNQKTNGDGMDKGARLTNMLSLRDSFHTNDTCRFKVNGWKNIYHVNGRERKTTRAILVLDKTDFILLIFF